MRKRRQLILKPIHVSDLPFRVLEDAYWAPQEAHLKAEYSRKFREENSRSGRKEYQRLKRYWTKREAWIGYAFEGILLAASPRLLASVFDKLIPGAGLFGARAYSCNLDDLKGDIGVPDFILGGQDGLLLGELKVGASPTSHRYSFQQYTKYMYFSAICRWSRAPELPTRVSHMVLCPDASPEKLCADYAQWHPSIDHHRLLVDPSLLQIRDRKKRLSDFESWRHELRKLIEDPILMTHNELRPDASSAALAMETPMVADTFVYTWSEFASVFKQEAARLDGEHLVSSIDAVLEMASPSMA